MILGGLIAAIGFVSMGCVVTDEIQFPVEAACAPTIRSTSTAVHPLDQIVRVDLDSDMPDGGVGEIVFETLVRDCNVDQTLTWQAFLDFVPGLSSPSEVFAGDNLLPTGSEERSLDVRLSFAELAFDADNPDEGRCHKVELLVSGGVRVPPNNREPIVAGDIGAAVWWIAVTDDTHFNVNQSTCP